MRKNNESVKMHVLKILLSVAVLIICFFRNRFIPQDNAALVTIGTVVTIILLIGAFYLIFTSVSQLFLLSGSQNEGKKEKESQTVVWDYETLFAYLKSEDIVDLIVENSESQLSIGVRSEYIEHTFLRKNTGWQNKIFYIEAEELTDFEEFKTKFVQLMKTEHVVILSAKIDDMVLDLSKWCMKK